MTTATYDIVQARPIAEDGRQRLILNAVTWSFVLSVFMMKLSIFNLEAPLIIVYSTILYLAMRKCIRINVATLILYLIFVAAILLSSIANISEISYLSMVSVAVFYAMFIFGVEINKEIYLALLKRVQVVGMIVAILVFSNWIFNFMHRPWPNLNEIVPKDFLYINYVYIQPIHWGSKYIKPNAIFFLETSHTGQFLALVTVIEICFFRRIKYLAALPLATVLTFSGTGLLLVALCVPFMLGHLERRVVLVGLVCAPLILGVGYSVGLIDNVIKRTSEFSSDRESSGKGRFVTPFLLILSKLDGPAKETMFGEGAGRGRKNNLAVLLNSPSKVMVEYGLVGLVPFLMFITYAVCGGGAPFVISWALLMQYHFLNASFLVPVHLMYCYLLAGMFFIRNRPDTVSEAAIQTHPRRMRPANPLEPRRVVG